MDRWMDGWMDGLDGWMGWMAGWLDGRLAGWLGGWSGWMDGWMDRSCPCPEDTWSNDTLTGSTNLQVKVLRISRRRRCSFVVKVLGMSVGNLKPSESIREFPKIGGTLFRGPYNKDPTI